MRLPAVLLVLPLTLLAVNASAQSEEPAITYPETARGEVVEEHFGVSIADPYRWLENDVREDPQVRAWVTAQNEVTDAYLATLPGRAAFRARMRAHPVVARAVAEGRPYRANFPLAAPNRD